MVELGMGNGINKLNSYHMKKKLSLFWALSIIMGVLCTVESKAQNQQHEKQITQQVQVFFEGLNSKDTLKIKATLAKQVDMSTLLIKDNQEQLVKNDLQDFLNQIGRLTKDFKIQERISNLEVHVNFPLASVLTNYQFYVNDELSHSGVNLFNLAFFENKWQIISINDSRQ